MVLLIPLNAAVAMKIRTFQVGAVRAARCLGKGHSLTWGLSPTGLAEYGWLQAAFSNLSSLYPRNNVRGC